MKTYAALLVLSLSMAACAVGIDDRPHASPTDAGAPSEGGPTGDTSPAGDCTKLVHDNGVGGTYSDCSALGTPGVASTYTEAMAREAAASWSAAATITTSTCSTSACISAQTGTACTRWCFGGALAGRTFLKATATKCACPYPTDPTWN